MAGFVIARDAMRGGITSDTFREAGIIAGATLAAGVAVDYAAGFVVKQASKYIAKLMLEAAGKKISQRVLSEMVGKTLGGSLQIAFALYFAGDAIYNYNKGNMTQTEMMVNVGIVFFTTAATVFLTCTQVGTALGGPVGTAIGVAIGSIGGLASGVYSWYVERQRQERLLLEARHLADWETSNNCKRLRETISKLQADSERMRNEAWRGLLSAD